MTSVSTSTKRSSISPSNTRPPASSSPTSNSSKRRSPKGWKNWRGCYSQSDRAKMYISKNTKKSVNQASITANSIKNMPIPESSVEEQNNVVFRLDSVQSIIDLYYEQLKRLDELIKSRFVEMFGDPVSNSLGWQTILMKRLASKIGSGATPKGGRESYGTEGITLIRSMNVYNGCFEYKDLAYISDDQAKN